MGAVVEVRDTIRAADRAFLVGTAVLAAGRHQARPVVFPVAEVALRRAAQQLERAAAGVA